MLAEKYDWYYARPTADRLRELLAAAKGFRERDFLAFNRRVAEVARPEWVRVTDPYYLLSSGSTGKPRRYLLAPHGQTVVDTVEGWLKNPQGGRSIGLTWNYNYRLEATLPGWRHFPTAGTIREHISADWTVHAPTLVKLVLESTQPVHLVAQPNVAGVLVWHPHLSALLRAGRCRLSTTNTEGFYPRRFAPVDDQMIDWTTGVNFFTCRWGERHFYPLFHREADGACSNLLNLVGKAGRDDVVEIGEGYRPCRCGRDVVPFRFLPHADRCPVIGGRPFHDLTLADRLVGVYRNIQFVQVGERVVVHFVLHDFSDRMPDRDREAVATATGGCDWSPNTVVLTSGSPIKVGAFHRTDSPQVRRWRPSPAPPPAG